ncbi:hypothetical protein E2C01_090241 [Portunus trituberculatus]|uniref:Uncharacterized protein n=1 Tax=Portunus trituberculatus TaxID=210409 RepID=A0A5B7JPK7_PORTR|nr:hypothetical protein [Portunus trituberculatus]
MKRGEELGVGMRGIAEKRGWNRVERKREDGRETPAGFRTRGRSEEEEEEEEDEEEEKEDQEREEEEVSITADKAKWNFS